MKIKNYKFTGFYPSGNPFTWYYDEEQCTMFTTSLEVQAWLKEPKIGDIVTFIKDENFTVIEVYINDELVFERNEETIKALEKIHKENSNALYMSKGLYHLIEK